MADQRSEHQFKGAFAEEYDFLKTISPGVVNCARESSVVLSKLSARSDGQSLRVLEIGCGGGLSTRAFLDVRTDLKIEGIDLAPAMLDQAKVNLANEIESGRLSLHLVDALTYLQAIETGSYDVIISNYAIHNFLEDYRQQVLIEIARTLKPGATFINGDRYGLDDPIEHLRAIQGEVRGYFRYFKTLNRWDLIEDWVIHVLSDESLDHVMRLDPSLAFMTSIGLGPIDILYRDGIDTVLSAQKPLS